MAGHNNKNRDARRADSAHAFRLWHEGQEFIAISVPLEPANRITLTPAQIEVARAIIRGDSNAAIARARGTSVHTVANQVASILRRLGVESRAQIATKLTFVDLDKAH